MSKTLMKSTSIVVVMTMISRVFGFARDMVTAQFFGAAAAFDAFSIAFRIPNFMRRLFAEGSFSQAFVPVLSEYQKKKSPEEVKQFLDAMFGTLALTLLMVTILGVVFAPWIVRLFAPGFSVEGQRFDLAVTMLRINFPYLMLISLTAFSGAILNTQSRFWVAAFTPVLLNVSMISAAIWLSPRFTVPIVALAYGVLAAGFLQLLFQIPFLRQLRMLPRPRLDFHNPGMRRVLKLMVPALFGVSVSQVNLLLDSVFASFLIVGSVSWLYYSDRLMEFPLGVFGVAISTVILPHLSRHHASESPEHFSHTIDWAIRMVLVLAVPATLFLTVIAGPLLSTLFQHGKFDAHAVTMARKSLIAFSLGVTPFMLVKVLAAGFYARQDLRTPVRIGVLAMVTNMVFNLLLIWPLAHAGIALATSLAAILNSGLLFYYLRKYAIYRPRSGWGAFAARLGIANGLMLIWLWWGSAPLSQWLVAPTMWRIKQLLLVTVVAGIVYLFSLWLVGIRPRDVLIPKEMAT